MTRYEILLGQKPNVPPASPVPSREELRAMLKKHPPGSFPSLESKLLMLDLGASRCVPLPKIAPENFIPGRPTAMDGISITIDSTPGGVNQFFEAWRSIVEGTNKK
jgi:hypothetical protein